MIHFKIFLGSIAEDLLNMFGWLKKTFKDSHSPPSGMVQEDKTPFNYESSSII